MINYNAWKTETFTMNGAFPVPTYTAEIGKDEKCRVWYVRVKYRINNAMYLVAFDYTEGDETPFLKDEVIYAENYWLANARVYNEVSIEYCQFTKVVSDFMESHGIKEV